MVMKKINKYRSKSLLNNIIRFLSIMLIVAVGIGFVTGVGGISPKVRSSFNEEFDTQNIADINVKCKTSDGFSDEDILKIKNIDNVLNVVSLFSYDFEYVLNEETEDVRLQLLNYDSPINKLKLVEGRMPEGENEILVENDTYNIKEREIGEVLTLYGMEFTVVGKVQNPLYFRVNSDESLTTSNPLTLIAYADTNYLSETVSRFLNRIYRRTDIYIDLDTNSNRFSDSYFDIANEVKDKIITELGDENVAVLTLNENWSYAFLSTVCDKVDIIALCFPVFFILVVALVVLTTLSRMLSEERSEMGCLKSLGYKNIEIISKYLIFGILSTILGIVIGLFVGAYTLPIIIYPAFDSVFINPIMTDSVEFKMGIISSIFMLASVIAIILYLSIKELKSTPQELLKVKAPKPGKKILLERIPLIWNHLKFKQKSALRNIFRYKGRLLMVIISVAGATVMVFAGMSLYDISLEEISLKGRMVDLGPMFTPISIAVILFALALLILVLFNLTNMNIGERQRELATLKVLGYHKGEVLLYIYREIFVMCLIGIVIGVPAGVGVMIFIFNLLEFGAIKDVSWVAYILTVVICVIFIALVFLMLKPKIDKIDMNDSLKSLE